MNVKYAQHSETFHKQGILDRSITISDMFGL